MILKAMQEFSDSNYSDLHIREGEELIFRIKGTVVKKADSIVSRSDIREFLEEIDRGSLLSDVDRLREVDFSFSDSKYRYRGNIFIFDSRIGIVLRRISEDIKNFDLLGLSSELKKLCEYNSGIVMITGPTGSGKSTTLAAMVEYINTKYNKHIITIEDPIEYSFKSKSSLITQREVGRDSKDFSSALRASLRQDPDIIVIGEVRDEETIKIAMRAAETGHLCICTMHTLGAAATVERVVDLFSIENQDKARINLSRCLRAVVSQQLIESSGTIFPIIELMRVNKSIEKLIRDGNTQQISTFISLNQNKGMISMDESLSSLYSYGVITEETLRYYCIDKEYIGRKLSQSKWG